MRLCAVWTCDEHTMSIDKACCTAAVEVGWIELLTPEEEHRVGLTEQSEEAV